MSSPSPTVTATAAAAEGGGAPPAAVSVPAADNLSDEMRELLAHKKEIDEWIETVNSRVYEMEEKYLLETPHGNIIRGWDVDMKAPPATRAVKVVEDKDRMFTYSCNKAWLKLMRAKETAANAHKKGADDGGSGNKRPLSAMHGGGDSHGSLQSASNKRKLSHGGDSNSGNKAAQQQPRGIAAVADDDEEDDEDEDDEDDDNDNDSEAEENEDEDEEADPEDYF